jgi:phage-related protein
MVQRIPTAQKLLEWVRSSRDDLKGLPEDVQDEVGYALYLAQIGEKHPNAKPLKGFKGAGVLEVLDNYDGDTYRAVYTVRFAGVIYVLHAFQKKSKKGIATPPADMQKTRLNEAEAHYEETYVTKKTG